MPVVCIYDNVVVNDQKTSKINFRMSTDYSKEVCQDKEKFSLIQFIELIPIFLKAYGINFCQVVACCTLVLLFLWAEVYG